MLAIADELTEDGLVLRYKVDTTDTGFEGKEGTFTICSFWLVTALAMIGEQERARALCKKLLAFAGPLQLYAEEIDAATGEHLGNFPQAFTHLALIDAVGRLIEAEHAATAPHGSLTRAGRYDEREPRRLGTASSSWVAASAACLLPACLPAPTSTSRSSTSGTTTCSSRCSTRWRPASSRPAQISPVLRHTLRRQQERRRSSCPR